MSLSENKRKIFTTIGAYSSMQQQIGNLPELRNSFSSINNSKDPLPFLIDILKSLKGSDALVELTGDLFTEFLDEVEPKIKDAVKNLVIQGNAGDLLPTEFQNSGNGFEIPLKNIDISGKLKINPNSNVGSLLYSDNTNTFDKVAYDAILNSGTFLNFGNLSLKYNEISDTINVKSTLNSGNIGSWLIDYIDNTQIIDKKEMISNVLNMMYGTITSKENKTQQEIVNELKIDLLLNKIIAEEENLTISNKEYEKLLNKSDEIANGVLNYDMGCGIIGATLTFEKLSEVVSRISGSTDPFIVGNEIKNTINDSFVDNDEILENNSETIKDGFFSRIIKAIYLMFIKALTATPQGRMLMGIVSAFENNGISVLSSDFTIDIQNFKTFIKCVIKELLKFLNEHIYNIIAIAISLFIKPIIERVVEEKINSYTGIIKSLISTRL